MMLLGSTRCRIPGFPCGSIERNNPAGCCKSRSAGSFPGGDLEHRTKLLQPKTLENETNVEKTSKAWKQRTSKTTESSCFCLIKQNVYNIILYNIISYNISYNIK